MELVRELDLVVVSTSPMYKSRSKVLGGQVTLEKPRFCLFVFKSVSEEMHYNLDSEPYQFGLFLRYRTHVLTFFFSF